MSNLYSPLELHKLCCNIIVKELYDNDECIFIHKLQSYNLPDDIYNLIIERYELIKHIMYFEPIKDTK